MQVFVRLHTPTGLIYAANQSFAGPIEGEPTFNFAAILYMDRDSKVCGYNIQVRPWSDRELTAPGGDGELHLC